MDTVLANGATDNNDVITDMCRLLVSKAIVSVGGRHAHWQEANRTREHQRLAAEAVIVREKTLACWNATLVSPCLNALNHAMIDGLSTRQGVCQASVAIQRGLIIRICQAETIAVCNRLRPESKPQTVSVNTNNTRHCAAIGIKRAR